MSEWAMLLNAEDIVLNDLIIVEREDGRTTKLRYINTKDDKYVMLKDGLGDTWCFCADSLEEIDGKDRVIIGKFEAE